LETRKFQSFPFFSIFLVFNAAGYTQEIFKAVQNGDLATVRKLLKKEPGLVNQKNNSGKTPLHIASSSGNVQMAEFLIEMEANVNAKDKFKNTPLHIAANTNSMMSILVNLNEYFLLVSFNGKSFWWSGKWIFKFVV